jgi:hypothetical protein
LNWITADAREGLYVQRLLLIVWKCASPSGCHADDPHTHNKAGRERERLAINK